MQLFSARAAGVLAMVGLSLSLAPCCAVSAATLGPGENLALNRKMEWSRPPDYPRCTDAGDAAQLTDGEISERQWWDQRMVGWQGNARIALTVDLGEVLPVGGVRIRFGGARGNVFYPLWICVFTSDDRKQWFPAGRIRFEDFLGEVNDEQYRTLALEDARAAGRYVCLLMRPQGQYTMLDEVEVLRGGHAPGEVAHDPATALDRPDVVDLYPREEAYVCPEFAIPLNFHKNVQRSGAPGVDLYLPEGVTIAAADAEPVADAFAPQPAPARGRRASYPTSLSTLYLRTSWKAGQEGDLLLAVPAGVQRVRLHAISIPRAKRPRRLVVDMDWVDVSYRRRWPGFFDLWEHVGLNTVSLSKSDTARPVPDAELGAFVAEARRRGFQVAANYSPFFETLQRASRENPGLQRIVGLDGKTSHTLCPRLYFREHYQSEMEEILRGVGHGATSYWLDFEPEWGVSKACYCPGCKRDFAAFLRTKGGPAFVDPQEFEREPEKNAALHQVWEQFQIDFGRQVTAKIRGALAAEAQRLKLSPAPRFPLGYYDVSPLWEKERGPLYHQFLSYTGLRDARLIEVAMPSLYSRVRDAMGDAVRHCRANLGPGVSLVPWVGITLGREEWRYVLLENFANGAQGFTYFTARYVDGRDYRTLAEVLRAIEPVEDLIMDGDLLDPKDARAAGHGRVVGLRRGEQMLLLVTNYRDTGKGAVTVRLPGLKGAAAVTDLETGENLASVSPGKIEFRVGLTAGRRARLLWVK